MATTLSNYNLIKRAMRFPSMASKEARAIFEAVNKLPTVRTSELVELKDNYEGDHEKLIEEYILKPPAWDPATWSYVKKTLMAINSTRTSLRSLSAGVYGGIQFRKVTGSDKGPFDKQLNEYIAKPEWRGAMKRILKETALYGTAYAVPEYDTIRRRFAWRHLNPVTTHILTTEIDPETPVAVAEFDQKRNWVRIWASDFYAVLSRKEDYVEYQDFTDSDDNPISRPFFPVLIAKSEEVPGSPYGISMLRDTPKFNRSLAVSYFNVSFSSLVKAQALLTITSGDSSDEVNADLTQLGPHSALILPKGAAAEFISNNADITNLMDVIDRLQDLESYILGIPNIRAQKNLSAEGARLAATPLTSQISDLALLMTAIETMGIHMQAMNAHWEVGSPATPDDSERMYKVTIRINPSINVESLGERVQNRTMLADKGVIPDEDLVGEFNTHMSYDEVLNQAEVVKERRPQANPPLEKTSDVA